MLHNLRNTGALVRKIAKVSSFTMLGLLGGCASQVSLPFSQPSQDYSQLYLRGVFSWWEAEAQFKVVEKDDDRFSTSIKLIADGQPYDFKFADANWTPGLSCGTASGTKEDIQLDVKAEANCDGSGENFRFTPPETGTYEFVIDFSDEDEPLVSVVRIG